MSLETYISEIRLIALADGAVADDSYWSPSVWRNKFDNGFSPEDAWLEEQHAALRAL